MTVNEFHENLTELYPRALSCEWDNDGIMCSGNTSAPVRRVMVALDCTLDVIEAAAAEGFDTLLTHHPMIFRKAASVTTDSFVGLRIITALQSGVSVISLHTRLDAGVGGVSDCLADSLGLSAPYSFGDSESSEIGRIGTTDISDRNDFAKYVKASLSAPSVSAYLCRPTHRIAVVGGSGGDFIDSAISAGADTLVTGECGYNAALDAGEKGLNVITAGHYHTEFPVCAHLAALARTMTGAEVRIFSGNTCLSL